MTIYRSAALSALLLTGLLAAQLCTAGACLAQTPPAAAAKVELPKTVAGTKAGLFIEAINSGDAAQLETFAKEHMPKLAGNPQGRMIQERTGGVDIVSVGVSSEYELSVGLKSRKSGAALTLLVRAEEAPPHILTALGIQVQ